MTGLGRIGLLGVALWVGSAEIVWAADRPGAAGVLGRSATAARVEKKTYAFKEAAGKEMEYALFVPSSYDKSKKTPMVLALHGLGSNPQQIMHYPGLTDLAEKYGYIVAAPMGYNSRGWYGARILIKGQADDPANLSELSEKDVLNVLEIVRKDYNVDPARIFCLGHSMGGGGTFHLAVKYPELFAALAPIAPAPVVFPAQATKIKDIPVILVQGDADKLVHVEWTRPWAEQMKKLEMTYEYVEVAGGDHLSVAFSNLPKIFEFFEKHQRAGKGKGQK
jgi:poly(3-hydroxybutyrate) depolymerase